MFKVPENKNIPEIENDILRYWKDNNIFERSVSERSIDNPYVFYDGPPFISGLPHYGHLLGSIAKDVIPRYWTMKGKRVERVWGWDAHGLTVENRVQKRLGIPSRRNIEEYGLEAFTKECYNYTSEISAEWEWYIDKIARWVDMKNAYKTIDIDYMESVIWAFKELYTKGLIYEGVRTSLFCTTCGTPVSNFEIAMDNSYKDVEDPSIIVEFPILNEGNFKDTIVLAWTTTPWTIPSNRGLVVDEKEDYVVVSFNDKKYVVAEKRLLPVLIELKNVTESDFKVLEKFKGLELIGLEYQSPYNIFSRSPKDYFVYSYKDMANMEDGTGIVHSAPGFGEIDTEMGYNYGLRIMLTIDDEGKFVEGDAEKNPFLGMFYKKADRYIREDLQQRGLLFYDGRVTHRFPFHDRCETLLIQKAQNSWFVDVNTLKPAMLEHNEKINWVPEHLKEGRFKQVIETSPDWCISRSRFWATPMPVWRSEDGDTIVVGSISELEELSGQEVTDLHRPYIDEIVINKEGKKYQRIPEVLDSWFEAGSMPYAQLHYPFENKEKFENSFPGDYIVEYIAQVRAWFNVMHRLSTALFDSHAFKNVITTGVMAGNDGRKMSKTYGNYADPREILETIGGDALRLYLMNSSLLVGENANLDEVELRNKSRNVLNPLWNSLKFFLIYAEYYNWQPNFEGTPQSKNVLDIWIMARLQETIKVFTENIEKYLIPSAVQALEDFIDDLSRWYVRRSRDRISSGDQEALQTLYYVLLEFSKTSAPIIPFMAEGIFQMLHPQETNSGISVHLEQFPNYEQTLIDDNASVLSDMKKTRDIVSAALSERVLSKIPARQPLGILEALSTNEVSQDFIAIIMEEANVGEVKFVETLTIDSSGITWLDITITPELELSGNSREMVRTIQDLRKKNNLNINDKINVTYPDTGQNKKIIEKFGEDIKRKVLAENIVSGKEYKIEKIL